MLVVPTLMQDYLQFCIASLAREELPEIIEYDYVREISVFRAGTIRTRVFCSVMICSLVERY